MDDNFLSERRRVLLILASAGLLIVLLIAGLSLFRRTPLQEAPPPAVKMDYCGAEPEGVCIFSFGRDGDGNTVINLFVSGQEVGDVQLRVIKAAGENVYTCVSIEEVTESVYCVGPALNINDQIQVDLLSTSDNHVLAAGKFTVKAILLVSDDPTHIKEMGQIQPESGGNANIPLEGANLAGATATPSSSENQNMSYPSYP